jgi:hypothetical protein
LIGFVQGNQWRPGSPEVTVDRQGLTDYQGAGYDSSAAVPGCVMGGCGRSGQGPQARAIRESAFAYSCWVGTQPSTRHCAYESQQPCLPEALHEQMGVMDTSTVSAWEPPSEWPLALHSQRDPLCAMWFWKQVPPGMAHEDGGQMWR